MKLEFLIKYISITCEGHPVKKHNMKDVVPITTMNKSNITYYNTMEYFPTWGTPLALNTESGWKIYEYKKLS